MMVFAMVFTIFPVTASAAYFPNINNNADKKIYKVYNYRSGDCNLSSNTHMIMRKAILLKQNNWKDIKNDVDPNKLHGGAGSVRKAACFNTDGYCNDVRNEYTFTKGKKYTVKRGSLPGGKKANEKRIRSLLKDHPEGVVVWGANCTPWGSHAVLATYISKKDHIKYVDSAHNTASRSKKYGSSNSIMNVGHESIGDTIVYGVGYFSAYWYIKKVK